MPIGNQAIGATSAKSGTLQYIKTRLQGIPLKIATGAGVTSVPNNRIVTIQVQTSTNKMFAVTGGVAESGHVIVGWGVIEEALQSGGVASIAPTPNNYSAGDLVTVLAGPDDIYAIDVDPSNIPADGIGIAYVDLQGRLTSDDTGTTLLTGSTFTALPGIQLTGQLKANAKFFQMGSALKA